MSTEQLWATLYMLLLTCIHVGAVALMWSAYCRSTGGAFLLTYLSLAVLYFSLPLMAAIFTQVTRNNWMWGIGEDVLFALFPVYILIQGLARYRTLFHIVLGSVPTCVVTGLFLLLARLFIVRRAVLSPRNVMLDVFRWLDRLYHRMNVLTGNVTLGKDRPTLPGDQPVAWREVTKKSMGKFHYLFRVLALIQTPTLIVATFTLVSYGAARQAYELSMLLFVLWPVAVLLLSVQATTAFVTKRTRQTLDVLLTTPLTGSQILWQKMAALRRLTLILFIPFLTIFFFEA